MRQLLFLIVLLIAVSSCRSTKTVTTTTTKDSTSVIDEKVRVRVDTFYKEKIIKINVPTESQVQLDNPCDSLGNLKPINTSIGSGTSKSWIFTKDGKLYLKQQTEESRSEFEKTYKAKYVQDSLRFERQKKMETSQVKETTKIVYRTPQWAWYVLVALIGFIVYTFRGVIFPKLSLLIKKLF